MIRSLVLATAILASMGASEAASGERSIALGFGPSNEVLFTLNRNAWGLYAYPHAEFSDDEFGTRTEYALRAGAVYYYSAFTYRQMECRAQIGAGLHGAWLNVENKYAPGYENKQGGMEAWLQPEFRFYGRFALLLEACLFKNTWEKDYLGMEHMTRKFELPDFAVSELKVGFRFYLQHHAKD